MIPRTLFARLSLALAVLLAGVGIVYALLGTSATRGHLEAVDQRFNRALAANLVADRGLVTAGQVDREALEETFHHYMVVNPSIEIYLLDSAGTILSYSADPGKVQRRAVSLEPILAFLRGDVRYPVLGDDPRSHDRRKAFSVTPVPSASDPDGYLYVILRGEEYRSLDAMLEGSHLLALSAWALGASLGAGLLAGLVVFRVLTRRLKALTARIEQFQEQMGARPQERGVEPLVRSGDEIDELTRSFEAMAARIRAQLGELERTDARRREMVANVSHDLRTPLATLHGYLETLELKAASLSEIERAEYLATALRSSDRLRRLVEELFELAKLDAREVRPRCEPFSLPELAQDVVQKLTLEARSRGIDLVLGPVEGASLVLADIGLVERVLDNLVENALAHTPEAGRVTVRVRREGDRVLLAVADTGTGIREEALPHIFERFYQADDAHRGSGQAGLGLAIARRILELHGSVMRVRSEPGRGSVFEFGLPIAV